MLEGTEPSAKVVEKQTLVHKAILKRSVVSVSLMTFNEECVRFMSLVELGKAFCLLSAILDKSIELEHLRAVERCVRPRLPFHPTDLAIDIPEIFLETPLLLEKRAIIHQLPNPHTDNRMARTIPKTLQILRPARDIDVIKQRSCSQRVPFLRHQSDVLEVAFVELSQHSDFQFGGKVQLPWEALRPSAVPGHGCGVRTSSPACYYPWAVEFERTC